ncbi:DUF6648 family protein [Acidaminobacter hydrogenoformans]|uniref:Uncharacterized protein n=1 Tax=Acidaminobacter hydrogenoformans DSM 2784 TaxID=1120920 RepID=A0A1G5S4Y4_9FIRM|nr:DUF6648 family protein [Acidaminobacter hydrogenoformans]SCZ81217.1 hypothetical protein SAMN03080599_02664 [Acidaminobacter hydrogenoformans DSM 2784]
MRSTNEHNNSTVADFLESFFTHRTLLIRRLASGEITKRFYLEQCHDYFEVRALKPFRLPIKTFEEGMMNYQYHNTYAKYYKMLMDESYTATYAEIKAYEKKMDEHYLLKDQATLALLEIVSYKNVEAYYLEMRSERLTGKLFEIVFTDRPLAILHSMDVRIQRKLTLQGCFAEDAKKSLIDDYVNTKY